MKWRTLKPDERHNWFVLGNSGEFSRFLPIGSKSAKQDSRSDTETVFKNYSLGVSTNRDAVVYAFDRASLAASVERFCDHYSAELDRYRRKGKGRNLDDFLDYSKIKWSRNLKRSLRNGERVEYEESNVRASLYRPFAGKWLYFADIAADELGQFRRFFPTTAAEQENRVIAVSDIGYRAGRVSALLASRVVDLHLCASLDGHQCFPFYVYDEDGGNRRENITDWALKHFREHYGNRRITKWDIFYYVYGILHHPGYRERFAENLKRDLPRVPLAPDFRAFATAGKELARLHLDYEKLEPWALEWIESPGVPLSYRVDDKMRLAKEKTALTVNDSLTLAGIPAEVFKYRLGNRSALEWVVDQYRVGEDKRSGIRSDPNRPDDPEYIVRLVGQVVRVSVETVKIVEGLPDDFGSGA